MKLMCYLICFVMGLLMVSCGGEEEPVTKDKPAPLIPVVNLIRSEPPNGGVIWIIDDLTSPTQIELFFFDRPPPCVSVGGIRAELDGDHAIWEVSTQQFLEVAEPNPAARGIDLSVAWVNWDGSDGEATLTFRIGVVGEPPQMFSGTVADGDSRR